MQGIQLAIRYRLALAKIPLCLLISCSTMFGSILANPVLTRGTLLTGCGILWLAAGAATLNSLQEYHLDAALARTRNRPLPRRQLLPHQAGTQALILLLVGLLVLHAATGQVSVILVAAFAIVLYNGLYTPLKKRSVWAIIPGALCGALPTYIGWLSGSGAAICYPASLLIVLFILWQVPHFWLVLLAYKEDYTNSDLPNLLQQFREDGLKRFFVTWIGALVLVMIMFLLLPWPIDWPFRAVILVNGALLLLIFTYNLAIRRSCNYRVLFLVLNCAIFLHMMTLAAGRIAA